MNGKYNLGDIYNDFFGNDIKLDNLDCSSEEIDADSILDEVNDLYILDDSKRLLEKIIKYMVGYKKGVEKNYVPFYVLLEINNEDLRKKIENILYNVGVSSSYIGVSKKKGVSLYKIDSDIDIANEGMLSIYELGGLKLEDDKVQDRFFHSFLDVLGEYGKRIVIVSGNKEELSDFFLGREEIRNKYFRFCIVGVNPDIQDIYNSILDDVLLEEDKKIELLDYLGKTYDMDCDYVTYLNELVNYISFNKEIPKLDNVRDIDDIFRELDGLVGLDKVKKVLHELVDVINLKEKSNDKLSINNLNLHMVFLGNPGTGKTTVARMVADILYQLGYIKENKLVEVSSKDLVGEYVGQTAPKTMKVIEKSLNGVLFIDEAYTLSVSDNNSYNGDAIATLIQAMENYRDKLVVIFAGYTDEMQEFLDSNSGITSRIGYTLYFDDYTTEELVKIFTMMMSKSGFVVTDEAISYLKEIIDKYRGVENFGNARFVRNIYEKTIIKHSVNVRDKKSKKILKTIIEDDISVDNLILE